MYIWYINICTVVTLYSIKMVYKEERKFYEERKIRLPPWIHSDFGRVCDRSGNVWRFPYITGQYGGAAFVLIYLLFLLILGLPIMVMSFRLEGHQEAALRYHLTD